MKSSRDWRAVNILMVLILTIGLIPNFFLTTGAGFSFAKAGKPEPIAIGAMRSAGTHLVSPSHDVVLEALMQDGVPMNASDETLKQASEKFQSKFEKQSSTWINPGFKEWVNTREDQVAVQLQTNAPSAANEVVPVTATVFAMAVQFGESETFNIPVEQADGSCMVESVTIDGPMQGEIVRPMYPQDNFTLWYSDTVTADAKFYEKLIFGYEGAGRVRMEMTDPDDGLPGINLEGYTVQDYYDNVAGDGNVTIAGDVEGWITVPYSEGRYGADNCMAGSNGGGAGVPVAQLVIDALDVFQASNPSYWTDPSYWPNYDTNHDGILDTFWIIHAGQGQEADGGAQGTFAIWSHSSDLRNYSNWPTGYKVYEGDSNTTSDDIYVGPYTMQPENADVGVFAEEFGHNFFGLPDLYTNDANNSVGQWAIMSGGSWNGYLGGTVPASMPLWFKMIAAAETPSGYVGLNWHLPMATRDYDAPAETITIGQLEKTPAGVNKGVRVSLPPILMTIPNFAGDGTGAYSGSGRDQTEVILSRSLDIPADATGVLSFYSYYEIEEDWDYGYFKVNGTSIPDMDGVATDYDPNGNNLGNGFTGYLDDTLRFDLAAYAGQTVTISIHYKTDAAVTEAGWWVDDLLLDGVLVDDFSSVDPATNTFTGWTNSDPGWYVVPVDKSYNQYYLTEWRTMTDYDSKIATTPYIHNTVSPDFVTRIPYNMPAALVYYRNTQYSSTYAMAGNQADPPSFGSKYQLLIVDQNWQPLRAQTLSGSWLTWSGRLSSYDSGLTLQDYDGFTIPAYYPYPGSGPWVYAEKDPVDHFNDTLGYYGGFYYGAPCTPGYLCYNERYGSTVIPARDLYSTRISTFGFSPIYGFYGYPYNPSWLGSGNPGDDNVQYGVNIKLLSKAGDDAYNSTANLLFYNHSVDFLSSVSGELTTDGYQVTYTTEIVNNSVDQDAINVGYELYPAPELSIQNIAIDGPEAVNATQKSADERRTTSTRTDRPDLGIILNFDVIPAGEKVTVTVTGLMPVPITSSTFDLYGELYGFDGQVNRGVWWMDLYEIFLGVYYFPLMALTP